MISQLRLVFQSLFMLSFVALSISCSPENPRLVAQPPQPDEANQELSPEVSIERPRLRVVFLMDNSGSMDNEQANLARNAETFVNAIASRDESIDMQFAVLSVWDRFTFAQMNKSYGKGELRHVRLPNGPNGTSSVLHQQGSIEFLPRFVDNTYDYKALVAKKTDSTTAISSERLWVELLKSTLLIGVESYNRKWEIERTGGPNHEEFLSPLVDAMSEPMRATNSDFFNPEQFNHLAVVIVSDSDLQYRHPKTGERQDLTINEFESELRARFGLRYRQMVSVHGVLASSKDTSAQCDPILWVRRGDQTRCREPERLKQLIARSGGIALRLQDPEFGQALSRLGQDLKQKVRHVRVYPLNSIPEVGTIEVKLGEWVLQEGVEWKFDIGRNAVLLSQSINSIIKSRTGVTEALTQDFDANISIRYVKVRPAELLN